MTDFSKDFLMQKYVRKVHITSLAVNDSCGEINDENKHN